LLVIGLVTSMTYSSSPYRTLDRDFQISCYRAGEMLRGHSGATVASVGSGPYQEHGVGWEAGYKAAYFGDRWLVAATDQVPGADKTAALLDDLSKAAPDAVMIWRRPADVQYRTWCTKSFWNRERSRWACSRIHLWERSEQRCSSISVETSVGYRSGATPR
jgi:hypothetical protein